MKLAVPPLRVAVPSVAEPSWNVTEPVAAAGVTVAVRVTVCPTTAGFGVAESAVWVVARATVRLEAAEVLTPKRVSPPYEAVRLSGARRQGAGRQGSRPVVQRTRTQRRGAVPEGHGAGRGGRGNRGSQRHRLAETGRGRAYASVVVVVCSPPGYRNCR